MVASVSNTTLKHVSSSVDVELTPLKLEYHQIKLTF